MLLTDNRWRRNAPSLDQIYLPRSLETTRIKRGKFSLSNGELANKGGVKKATQRDCSLIQLREEWIRWRNNRKLDAEVDTELPEANSELVALEYQISNAGHKEHRREEFVSDNEQVSRVRVTCLKYSCYPERPLFRRSLAKLRYGSATFHRA